MFLFSIAAVVLNRNHLDCYILGAKFPFFTCLQRGPEEREVDEDRKTRLSVAPGHRTVQEGLSMVSRRESITKSKHVYV